MKYRIGDVADIMGVSIETVRHYEKQGLVIPIRDSDSGYRLYEPGDLDIMRMVRFYLAIGYTLSEAMSLVQEGDLNDLANSLGNRINELKRTIEYNNMLLNFVTQKERHLQRVKCMPKCIVVENSPAMFSIINRSGDEFVLDRNQRDLIKQWNQYRPFAEFYCQIPASYWRHQSTIHSVGLCMEKQYADFLGVISSEYVCYHPSRKSLYTIFEGPYEPSFRDTGDYIAPWVNHELDKGRYKVAGETIARVLHTGKKSGQYTNYNELWIPVDDLT